MPPKKREKDADVSKIVGRDQIQAEHELFLQAFEKPTQIYRYLRTRNMISPVFLHRTLTYMKHRMSRNHKKRSEFKVDSMLAEKMNKTRLDKTHGFGDYMTLMFLGFFDKNLPEDNKLDNIVRVETALLKISHKKRKDSASALMQVTIGSSDVDVNPMETNENSKVPAISIPSDSFKSLGASQSQSYILVLSVETLPRIVLISDNDDEPTSKRQKPNTKVYASELVVFDKHNRCLLSEGEYELALQEVMTNPKNCSPKKHSTWEVIPDDTNLDMFEKQDNPFVLFTKCPTLKFWLRWTQEPCQNFVERPKAVARKMDESLTETNTGKENFIISGLKNHNNNTITPVRNGFKESYKPEEQIQIVYQFIYNNNSRQQTEPCDDMHCPWCSLDCITLYSLLKHLKLCHARFTFTYVPVATGARIDVAINDMYDGSYTGSPHDLVGPAGRAFARTGPVRRTVVTNLLVVRPRRQKPSLTEFLELDENELNNQRPYITGHNRLYHHTETCLPVHPKELDIDSEGESDPLWLQHKTMQMIDEFTDVNEGEKELMKMWNLHVMKNGYVGDCQLPIACDMFLDMKGREILYKNLYRNFVLHMCSLLDYGLVSPEVVYKTIQKLQSILSTYPESRKVISESREAQVEYWLNVGMHKQAQKEELQQKQQVQNLHKPNDTKISSTSKTTQSNNQKTASVDAKKYASNDKSQSEKSKDTNKLANGESSGSKRRLVHSHSNESTSNKRRLSQIRDSPPRRRSAPLSDQPKKLPARRKSLAVLSGGNQPVMRKRLSVPINKADKH